MIKSALHRFEEAIIIFVGEALLAEMEQWVLGCQFCDKNATVRLDYLLDALTESDPAAEYLMFRPVLCPSCAGEITEKTLVVV